MRSRTSPWYPLSACVRACVCATLCSEARLRSLCPRLRGGRVQAVTEKLLKPERLLGLLLQKARAEWQQEIRGVQADTASLRAAMRASEERHARHEADLFRHAQVDRTATGTRLLPYGCGDALTSLPLSLSLSLSVSLCRSVSVRGCPCRN